MRDNESSYISWIIVLIKNKFATDLVSKDAALQYYHNVVVATRILLVLRVSLNSQDIREKSPRVRDASFIKGAACVIVIITNLVNLPCRKRAKLRVEMRTAKIYIIDSYM